MHFDRILERNRSFAQQRTPQPLPPAETIELAVVGCYDPRLDELLLSALGLAHGQAFVLRTGGALVQPHGAALRSLGLAVFMFGVAEIVVVGHTSCRMAGFDASAFIDSFRRRGVARDAFGAEDIRTWAGAIPDPKRGVQMSVANILAAPFLPKDVKVGGMLLNDSSGALEVVARPGDAAPVAAPAPAPTYGVAPTTVVGVEPPPLVQAAPAAPQQSADDAGAAPTPAPPRPEAPQDPLVRALGEFLRKLQTNAKLRDDLRRVRSEMDKQANPLVKFGLLEGFIRRAAAGSKEVADAYADLRHEITAGRRRWDPQEVVHYFLQLTRRT